MTLLISPPRFAIAFGLTGLAGAWDAAADRLGADHLFGDLIAAVAAVVLVALVVLYVAERRSVPGEVGRDLRHPVFFPFFALPIVSAELLVARLASASPDAVAITVGVLAAAGAALGAVHLGRLLRGEVSSAQLHGGQLLPSVAGTLVPSLVFARLGFADLAAGLLGVGSVLAVVFTSLIVGAAVSGAPTVPALRPTLVILVAPPALAGLIGLELGADPLLIRGLLGLTVAAFASQAALLPAFRRAGFLPTWWSFSFPIAAAVAFGLRAEPGALAPAAIIGWTALAALTLALAVIAILTVRFEMRVRQRLSADS